MRSQGNVYLYKLNADTLSKLNQSLFSPQQMASWTIRAEAWEEKVFKNYFDGDYIKKRSPSKIIKDLIVIIYGCRLNVRLPELTKLLTKNLRK